ncbi:MAG: hypothetical protein JWO92_1102 [Chitinophagaceae bacterium]|nr:hypothetical protein [Chitinophagaceae bacterium]
MAEDLIDIRELRIGNILNYDSEFVHVTMLSCDIDDEYTDIIGFCKLGQTINEKSDWNRALTDKLKPVPITSEILEKCGFRVWGNYYLSRYCALGKNIDDGVDQYFPCLPKSEIESTIIGVSFKYVHQLQNYLFGANGDELTIDL